jgi:iron complex outermembrane receptor protein
MRGFLFSFVTASLCLFSLDSLYAKDTTAVVEELSEAIVLGVRASRNAPFAVANLGLSELQEFSSSGRELPMLFSRTPGVLAWSDNGLGIGTTYMRIRGAGDSRINVTIDGVPLNSPEDQCVFWANMNGYSSLLGSAQIQGGVGTSTNGDGAFGGSVSLSTKQPSYLPGGEISSSFGSCNTFNTGASFSTGLFWEHLIAEGAYNETSTDGYMHGTSGRSGSYYFGLNGLGRNFIIRYHHIGNFENTGQAWNGATAGNNDASLMDEGIKTYQDMYAHGLGRYNSLYEQIVFDAESWSFPKDSKGNYQTQRYKMRDGSYWPQTTDNFWQNHNILSFTGRSGQRFSGNAALHYTYGYGYYEEFRHNNKLGKFGLSDPLVSKTDFVRKKGLKQNSYGLVANVNYSYGKYNAVGGISLQQFKGGHFGLLSYIADTGLDAKYRAGDKDYKYYDSDASKNDYSIFTKLTYKLGNYFHVYLDLQYRHVDYITKGKNDKFYKNEDGTFSNQELDIDVQYNFFNPKSGISYANGAHRAYAGIAMSSREPERNNFTDNGSYPPPKNESVRDYEAGYQYNAGPFRLSANFYFMDYENQFVQTGAKSDIGEDLTTNIKSSYRFGTELSAAWKILCWLTFEGNAALSRNKILDFDEHVEDWDKGETIIHYGNSTLAYSPSAILNGFIDVNLGAFRASWHTGYVSRMYLDNTQNQDRSLPSYTTSDLNLSYTLKFPKFLREVVFGCNLSNIFNAHYAISGWVYSAICESGGYTNDNRYYQIGFFPAAGFTAMGSVKIKF